MIDFKVLIIVLVIALLNAVAVIGILLYQRKEIDALAKAMLEISVDLTNTRAAISQTVKDGVTKAMQTVKAGADQKQYKNFRG